MAGKGKTFYIHVCDEFVCVLHLLPRFPIKIITIIIFHIILLLLGTHIQAYILLLRSFISRIAWIAFLFFFFLGNTNMSWFLFIFPSE